MTPFQNLAEAMGRIAFYSDCAWRTLLQLRSVSSTFQEAADFLLFSNLTLHPSKDEEAVNVTSDHGELPPRLSRIRPRDWIDRHTGHDVLGRTNVVTIVGFVPPTCDLRYLRTAFRNIHYLRMMASVGDRARYTPYIPFGAPVLSLFAGGDYEDPAGRAEFKAVPSARRGMDIVYMALSQARVRPPRVRRELPANVRKIVVNTVNVSMSGPLKTQFHLPDPLPPTVKEVVVMVPFYHQDTTGLLLRWDEEQGAKQIAGMLTDPHVQYTIVGINEVPVQNYQDIFPQALRTVLAEPDKGKLGCSRHSTSYSKKKASKPRIPSPINRKLAKETASRIAKAENTMKRVSFLSIAEYLEGLGQLGGGKMQYEMGIGSYFTKQDFHHEPGANPNDPAFYLNEFPAVNIALEDDRSSNAFFEMMAETGEFF